MIKRTIFKPFVFNYLYQIRHKFRGIKVISVNKNANYKFFHFHQNNL